jgi:cytochrome c
MSTMELNKIMAAILLAGIIGMTSGFIANLLVHPEDLEQTAYQPDMEAMPAAGGEEEPAEEISIASLMQDADPAAGEAFSRACQSCHSFEQGGPNRVGPNLWAIVGEPMAHLDDFNYSAALEAAHDEGRVWGYEELSAFLRAPRDYMPGTSMSYAGIRDPEDRANVIAYLRSMDDDPPPLPEPPAEAPEEAAAEGEAAAAEGEAGAAEGEAGAAEGETAPAAEGEAAAGEIAPAAEEPAAGEAEGPQEVIDLPADETAPQIEALTGEEEGEAPGVLQGREADEAVEGGVAPEEVIEGEDVIQEDVNQEDVNQEDVVDEEDQQEAAQQ